MRLASFCVNRFARCHSKYKIVPLQKRALSLSYCFRDVSSVYRNGYAIVTLPLPSRHEDCEFALRPVSQTVKDLLENIKDEDKGVDRVAVYTMDGNRVSGSTTIDMLMQSDFKVSINENTFDVITPKPDTFPLQPVDELSSVKTLVSQLYSDLNVQEYKELRQQAIEQHLDMLKDELTPLEEQKSVLDAKAASRTELLVWSGLGWMALQFGFLARLTWWEYSWDIMEPVTYFVTFGSSLIFYAYFVLTKQDYSYPDARNRSHLLSFHRESKKSSFDTRSYNSKKEHVERLEYELKLLKSPPLYADICEPVKA